MPSNFLARKALFLHFYVAELSNICEIFWFDISAHLLDETGLTWDVDFSMRKRKTAGRRRKKNKRYGTLIQRVVAMSGRSAKMVYAVLGHHATSRAVQDAIDACLYELGPAPTAGQEGDVAA
jgi:hypothetical protein